MNLLSTPQQTFDKLYITSTEICQTLNVSRPAIHFRRKAGKLPNSITVFGQQILIWERAQITPYIKEWSASIQERRSAQ